MDANIRRLVNDATSLQVREAAALAPAASVTGQLRSGMPNLPAKTAPRIRPQGNPSHLGNAIDEWV